MMNTEKPNLLCIDDEARILRSLKVLFRRTHNVYATTSPVEYDKLLKSHHMHVIISDQRMPKVTGTELLRHAAKHSPNSMRILLTGYADLAAVIDSINEGEIFRYLTKPWNNEEIKIVVQKATEIALNLENAPSRVLEKTPSISLPPSSPASVDEPNPAILLINDDVKVTQSFCDTFCSEYNIKCAHSFNDIEALLATEKFCVAIINMEFEGEDLSPLICLLKEKHPALITIVLARFDDINSLINLINQGQIFRCLPHPVSNKMLEKSLQRAVEKHDELSTDSQQQLRHQVEKVSETAMASQGIKRITSLIRRIGGMVKV